MLWWPPTIQLLSLTLYSCNFSTVINISVNIWCMVNLKGSLWKVVWPQGSCDPQVENHHCKASVVETIHWTGNIGRGRRRVPGVGLFMILVLSGFWPILSLSPNPWRWEGWLHHAPDTLDGTALSPHLPHRHGLPPAELWAQLHLSSIRSLLPGTWQEEWLIQRPTRVIRVT